jgi:hypothetical protein
MEVNPVADLPIHHSVTIYEGCLQVDRWQTADSQIVSFFEEREGSGGTKGLAELLEWPLLTGVIALRAVGIGVSLNDVEREFGELNGALKRDLETATLTLKQALDKALKQDFVGVLNRYLGEGGRMDDLLDPARKDSAIGRIQALLDQHFNGNGSKMSRLLDPTNPQSPLRPWKESITQGFKEIRDLVTQYHTELACRDAADKARAEAHEQGTKKGRSYQELVFHAVCGIARVFGDTAELVADQPGVGGKKGDVVVTLQPRDTGGAAVRLAIEAKDSTLGTKLARRELDNTLAHRGAVAAIVVFSQEEHMPKHTAPFAEHGANRYLCLYDKQAPSDGLFLSLAYRVARISALHGIRSRAGGRDVGAALREVERARSLLGTVATLKRSLSALSTTVSQEADRVKSKLDEFHRTLQEVMDSIDAHLGCPPDGPENGAALSQRPRAH